MLANLAAAGIAPAAIDTVVISHFHPDHIDGLKTKDGD
jgi:metal-dependent hydrolase (beta-lactamase superfamily II)